MSAAPSRLSSDSITQKIRTVTENLENCVISTVVKIPCCKRGFIRQPPGILYEQVDNFLFF